MVIPKNSMERRVRGIEMYTRAWLCVGSGAGEAAGVAVAVALAVEVGDAEARVKSVGIGIVLVGSKTSVGIEIVLVGWMDSVGMAMLGTSVATLPLLCGVEYGRCSHTQCPFEHVSPFQQISPVVQGSKRQRP
jgi:hypothetical protein